MAGAACSCTVRSSAAHARPGSVQMTGPEMTVHAGQGSGSVLYLGFDFTEPITPWIHALIAATQFQEFDVKLKSW